MTTSGAAVALGDAAATERAGAALARVVRGGDAIALVGDLGAGKTTFVTGLVAELGGGAASSPTFALVNHYTGGRLEVWHVDLYRLEHARELPELGLDDAIGDPRGVVIIEWADKFAVLPADHLRLELTDDDAGGRTLVVHGTGARGSALATELLASIT